MIIFIVTVIHFLLNRNYLKILIEIKSRVKSDLKLFEDIPDKPILDKKILTNVGGNCNNKRFDILEYNLPLLLKS